MGNANGGRDSTVTTTRDCQLDYKAAEAYLRNVARLINEGLDDNRTFSYGLWEKAVDHHHAKVESTENQVGTAGSESSASVTGSTKSASGAPFKSQTSGGTCFVDPNTGKPGRKGGASTSTKLPTLNHRRPKAGTKPKLPDTVTVTVPTSSINNSKKSTSAPPKGCAAYRILCEADKNLGTEGGQFHASHQDYELVSGGSEEEDDLLEKNMKLVRGKFLQPDNDGSANPKRRKVE